MPLGIGMSNATQTLTIAAPVALGTNQTWVVANNQTLIGSGRHLGQSTGSIKMAWARST